MEDNVMDTVFRVYDLDKKKEDHILKDWGEADYSKVYKCFQIFTTMGCQGRKMKFSPYIQLQL